MIKIEDNTERYNRWLASLDCRDTPYYDEETEEIIQKYVERNKDDED